MKKNTTAYIKSIADYSNIQSKESTVDNNSLTVAKTDYRNFDYKGGQLKVKIVYTKHCLTRSMERVVNKANIIKLIDHGLDYIIDTANYNNSVPHDKFIKLISTLNNFYLVSKCSWNRKSKTLNKNSVSNTDYDIELVLVTVALDLFKSYRLSRQHAVKNKIDTFCYKV